MKNEVELKYLFDGTEDMNFGEGKKIIQVYLDFENDSKVQELIVSLMENVEKEDITFFKEARVRNKAGKFTLTLKGDGTKARPEEEMTITEEQFNEFCKMTLLGSISKIRYNIPLENDLNVKLVAECDKYLALAGLYTVEVEYPEHIQEEKVDQLIREKFKTDYDVKLFNVTYDKNFKNKSLSTVKSLYELDQSINYILYSKDTAQEISNVLLKV